MPAKAGIHFKATSTWIPAFAGMTPPNDPHPTGSPSFGVMPAKADIHFKATSTWIPAFAGVTSPGYRFKRSFTSTGTTSGSASVEMSPSWSCSLAAILRRMRRMILPERVFGRPGAH